MPDLDFKGKPFVYAHHLSVPFRELVIDPQKSLPGPNGPSLDDNLIIHGDNLEALKALLPRYAGKVDVIYIDPPYNTGNEGWAYNDNVNAPAMRHWLGKVVDRDDLERHDKWLCMMWPRLQLLRELLSDAGTLWVSMNDIEAAKLQMIGTEVFGEDNFICCCIWQKRFSTSADDKYICETHDYLVVFAKDKASWQRGMLPRTDVQNSLYSNPDNDPRGAYTPDNYVSNKSREERRNSWFAIRQPTTGEEIWPQPTAVWRYSKAEHDRHVRENRIWWGKDGRNRVPRFKRFLSDVKQGITPQTLWLHKEVGHNQGAKQALKEIFSDRDNVFDTPKPVSLIDRVLQIAGNLDATVLDSFAGSGTTAHAVLAANKRDNGNRKFILVETEEYANSLTAERVRRVVRGIPEAKGEELREGIEGTFTYCELGESLDLDRFFNGETSPAWDQVARYVVYTATGATLPKIPKKAPDDWFVGEAGGYRIHLLYKPDLAFMRGSDAAVSAQLADRIAKANTLRKPLLLYAAARFVSQKELAKQGITFCQLPYAIHRLLGDGPTGSIGNAP